MPTYSNSSPEPLSEAPQTPIDLSGFFSTEQHALAKQLAAKRTGNPDEAPTAADYFKAKDQLQPQSETERAAYEDEMRAKLRKQQREQARLNVIWGEDDAPSSFLLEEPPLLRPARPEGFARQQAQPWPSITNRMVIASALRNIRNRRAFAALRSPRNTRGF